MKKKILALTLLLNTTAFSLLSCETSVVAPQYNTYFQPSDNLLIEKEEASKHHEQQISNLLLLTKESLRKLNNFLRFFFLAISKLTEVEQKEGEISDFWGESITMGLRTNFVDFLYRWFKEVPPNLPAQFSEIKVIPSEKEAILTLLQPLGQQLEFITQFTRKNQTLDPEKLGQVAQILEKTLKELKGVLKTEEKKFLGMFKNYSIVIKEAFKNQKLPFKISFEAVEENLNQKNLDFFLNLHSDIKEFWKKTLKKEAANFSPKELSFIFQTFIFDEQDEGNFAKIMLQNKGVVETFVLGILLFSKAWKDFKDSLFNLEVWLLAAREPYQNFSKLKNNVIDLAKTIVEDRKKGVEELKEEFFKLQTKFLTWFEKLHFLSEESKKTTDFLNSNTEPFVLAKPKPATSTTANQEDEKEKSTPSESVQPENAQSEITTSTLKKFFQALSSFIERQKSTANYFLSGQNMVEALSKEINNLSDLLAYRLLSKQTALFWLFFFSTVRIYTLETKETLQSFRVSLVNIQSEFEEKTPQNIKEKEEVNKLVNQVLVTLEEQEKELKELEKTLVDEELQTWKESVLTNLAKLNIELHLSLESAWEKEMKEVLTSSLDSL